MPNVERESEREFESNGRPFSAAQSESVSPSESQARNGSQSFAIRVLWLRVRVPANPTGAARLRWSLVAPLSHCQCSGRSSAVPARAWGRRRPSRFTTSTVTDCQPGGSSHWKVLSVTRNRHSSRRSTGIRRECSAVYTLRCLCIDVLSKLANA